MSRSQSVSSISTTQGPVTRQAYVHGTSHVRIGSGTGSASDRWSQVVAITVSRRGLSGVEETLFALADGVLGVRGSLKSSGPPRRGRTSRAFSNRRRFIITQRLPGFAESSNTRVPVVDGMRLHIEASGEGSVVRTRGPEPRVIGAWISAAAWSREHRPG